MNFKKLVFAASLATFGLIGCASHSAPVAVNNPPPAPAVVVPPTPVVPPAVVDAAAPVDPLLLSGKGWSLKLTNDSWDPVPADQLPDGVLVRAENDDLSARIMLLSDGVPPNLSNAAFSKIVLDGIAGDGKVNKTAPVSINGNEFIWADVSMTSGKLVVHVQTWILSKNGNGYALMCGSPTNNPKVVGECKQIAETFKVN